MKKLNITKEQFNRSSYFKNKYGKLEYVSESGKLFKTSKGKVLKFKESNTAKKPIKMVKEGLFSDLGDELDSGISKVRKFFHGKPKFKKGDCVMLCMIEWSPCGISHGNIVSKVQWEDKKWYYEFEDGEYGDSWPEDALAIDPDPEGGYEKGDIKTLLKKYPEFIKRAKTIFNKSKWKEYGVIDESKGFKEDSSDEWDDAIFKPSNELQKLYKELKAKYEKGDIEIRLADMMFGTFWLVVEVPEDDVKTLDKMEKILKSKCEGNENWEVFREEHLYGDVSKVAIQENPPKEDKDDKKKPISKPKPPFLGIKGTQDHGTFIMYRNATIEKDELFEGIQAMLDDEGIDASAEDWASDPKNKREVRGFLMDYARFAKDY